MPRHKKEPEDLRSERVRVSVTPRLREQIRATARLLEMSESGFIALCIREYLTKARPVRDRPQKR